jgi:hypothetical protein
MCPRTGERMMAHNVYRETRRVEFIRALISKLSELKVGDLLAELDPIEDMLWPPATIPTMIQLELNNGNSIWVKPSKIDVVRFANSEVHHLCASRVYVSGVPYYVKETPEEIGLKMHDLKEWQAGKVDKNNG